MRFISTRGGEAYSAAQAIVKGISPSGGLFVPESYPALPVDGLLSGAHDYKSVAKRVFSAYLSDFDDAELTAIIDGAYGDRFDCAAVAPTVKLDANETVLELWHGPTLAFKDIALQALPHLMRAATKKIGERHEIYILVATSGDTGKAALAGFRDVPGTRVLVFYPDGGVSEAQRLQMVTQEGSNVDVCAVKGNFDDAQTGVKQIFSSDAVAQELDRLGYKLSSANSINFGRLLPQITYYYTSYIAAVENGSISAGDRVNFCVPTGNFGDILAGWYAMHMGLPVNKFICASNRNNVLTDFFNTGAYDANRPFFKSMSCSIDILISSNLERLLFDLTDRNADRVRAMMEDLKHSGRYEISAAEREKISSLYWADCCTEEDTLAAIRATFDKHGYLIDPHTAVAQTIYERYKSSTGDSTHTILLSTASPFKFATAVLSAFEQPAQDDFKNADRLSELTGAPVPAKISELVTKPELHNDICELGEMPQRVIQPCKK